MKDCTKPIQVFEYGSLQIGEDTCFKKKHWEMLGWYNETHGGRYFSLTPKGVRFNQYVGVIQAGDLVIEILPKVGKQAADSEKSIWRNVLLDMLSQCHWMHVHANEKAYLKFRANSILEAYLELFVNECETLLRAGLVKKYRFQEKNCKALKGKLIFGKNIQYNLVHQENFYTRHQVFDQDHLLNQILLKALKLVATISSSPFLRDRVQSLLLNFPELSDLKVTAATFERIQLNRKTESYAEALEIAAMLLLNYRPDISGGRNNVLAILFDMNDLWEEYIFRQLARYKNKKWSLHNQSQKRIWQSESERAFKVVRPDLVISMDGFHSIIIDTKWKLPDGEYPGDNDLKQMFVYNEFWKCKSALLLYPTNSFSKLPGFKPGNFINGNGLLHRCGMVTVSVLDESNSKLDPMLGERLVNFIEEEIKRCPKDYQIK
ncbi:hypothetical protein C943_04165 [Mariniradius saccharolyticus AK6]|uniref:McrBC 5-methylcytosine restriction system component n=1 Tax=Mariniradius saccharolyticus AK6 TaxID=1239962 RepID=M7Y9K0_9BACT|nr:hypothetical protein [Mariniradius saccharolyticus]EMS33846.1 hypothetical protein C943_04165 [Mariniradius saccharolyticus AK6]